MQTGYGKGIYIESDQAPITFLKRSSIYTSTVRVLPLSLDHSLKAEALIRALNTQ